MKTKQALVTCGGTGYRLRKGGMKFPVSKSFIEFKGHPMFYWCLLGLYYAGIERLVIVGDGAEKLRKAEHVLSDFPYNFSEVDWHEDPGFGSNELPYQARHLLDDYFFFECGHSISEPEHYHRMEDELNDENGIVLSMFEPKSYAPRPLVRLDNHGITTISQLTGANNEFSVGSPRLLNQEYISKLPELEFNLYKIVEFYSSNGLLKLVRSNMPLEVNVIEEWKEAIPIYKKHIEKLCARARTSPNSLSSRPSF